MQPQQPKFTTPLKSKIEDENANSPSDNVNMPQAYAPQERVVLEEFIKFLRKGNEILKKG